MKRKLAITTDIISQHGLSPDEYAKILDIMGREPNLTELGIFSVMWSEHCSYKSTRIHLKKLHTEEDWVICGPGENAGVIDIGDEQALIFKMESHNHPSFIEPYQGAATGVGGIMRDIFTMGARPIANLNSLRFGEISHPKTKHLLKGVVAGISHYGNCMGVPTVGGECNFHPAYNNNILVNAMTIGLTETNKIFYSAAAAIGAPVIYIGSKTGRDGIHGATMASAEFDDKAIENRPTVQVGDPFMEKLLLEACLELMQSDAIIAIQDMGAAGLTCSSLEMADKGNAGIELNLNAVPLRETGMTPYEIMLSESQERMLMVIKPEFIQHAEEIFNKWQLDFAIIGKITDSNKMILLHNDEMVAELPIKPLSNAAPIYDRPHIATKPSANINYLDVQHDLNLHESLKKLLSCPDLASKKWIWQQYDSQVMNDTLQAANGGDAALIRIHQTQKAIATSIDVTARYCLSDPFEGGKQAVIETWRNITATGCKPLAITNCLNFASPERPEIMGQLVGCLEGITEACKYLKYPVISGNVSLYNETNGQTILPTPTIGGVGLIDNYTKAIGHKFLNNADNIFIIGETKGHIGASLYLREIIGKEAGSPPPVDLALEAKNGNFVRDNILNGNINACHDISDGGMLVALFEMAANSSYGAEVNVKSELADNILAFAEDQARYIITIADDKLADFTKLIEQADIVAENIGKVMTGSQLIFNGSKISIDELQLVNEQVIAQAVA
ncbi:MAG: phosphoribosylformylglycinamidine synthase subunit PurL [Pseudomonadota bacterium]